jgi:predicted nucleotidyltransferase
MSGNTPISQAIDVQNRLHRYVGLLVNGHVSTPLQLATALVSKRYAHMWDVKQVISEHSLFKQCCLVSSAVPEEIQIPYSAGKNKYVIRMIEALEPLEDDLLGAYIHGSLGTYEEITYSDFDALVVIRDSALESEDRLSRLAIKLGSLQKIMLQHDPLQHHGWFVLVETDFSFYCDAYFPRELFRHAKSMLQNHGTKIQITTRDSSVESLDIFMSLCNSISLRIDRGDYPRALYELKSLLSEVMLLPALYIQLRDGNAVYKKYSFDLARADFTENSWEIMDRISAIRAGWNYAVPWHRTISRTLPAPLSRIGMRYLSPSIPDALSVHLNKKFYSDIVQFVIHMRQTLTDKPGGNPGC